jgi:hypothetical protein
MGVSSDGLVFFGILIAAEGDIHGRIEEEKRAGPDGEPNPGTLGWLVWMGDEDGGCIIGTHCSGEYPMYFVALRASVVRAWRGRPVDLSNHAILRLGIYRDTRIWPGLIAEFCRKWDIPHEEPRWYLASYWG